MILVNSRYLFEKKFYIFPLKDGANKWFAYHMSFFGIKSRSIVMGSLYNKTKKFSFTYRGSFIVVLPTKMHRIIQSHSKTTIGWQKKKKLSCYGKYFLFIRTIHCKALNVWLEMMWWWWRIVFVSYAHSLILRTENHI